MSHATKDRQDTGGRTTGGYLPGIRDVVVLELKQRLRSRGWYIMLAIWFVLTGLVAWLTWAAWAAALAFLVASTPFPGASPARTPGAGVHRSGALHEQPAMRTERVAWLLAMDPYVVVADASPYKDRSQERNYSSVGAIENISQGARYAMAGPESTYPCANGEVKPRYLAQSTPLWPWNWACSGWWPRS